mmetsp:Transcript_51421/g.122233  ORF Transcript_51421/g.122233 Transcript_51421/m.122233 type:complete len:203 (-) Transcript_51421:215-823(-)
MDPLQLRMRIQDVHQFDICQLRCTPCKQRTRPQQVLLVAATHAHQAVGNQVQLRERKLAELPVRHRATSATFVTEYRLANYLVNDGVWNRVRVLKAQLRESFHLHTALFLQYDSASSHCECVLRDEPVLKLVNPCHNHTAQLLQSVHGLLQLCCAQCEPQGDHGYRCAAQGVTYIHHSSGKLGEDTRVEELKPCIPIDQSGQ